MEEGMERQSTSYGTYSSLRQVIFFSGDFEV